MSLHLTATDRRHLVAAQQAMLSPLAYEHRGDWMRAVNDRIREFLGADHTIAFFVDENGFESISGDTDIAPLGPLEDMVIGWDADGSARFDHGVGEAALYFEMFHRLRRAGGSGAYHERQVDVTEEMKRTDLWQAMFTSIGVRFMTGLSTPLPIGEATTCVAYERPDAHGYGEEGLRRLELLVPAYEAGIRTWRRMDGCLDMLDDVAQALAVFSRGGRLLFRSRALDALLSEEPASSVIVERIRNLARGVSRWGRRPRRKSQKSARSCTADVKTDGCTYRLCASPLSPTLFGTAAVLVQVDRSDTVLPAPAEVEARFGLTPREAEVALLLAEGLSNRAIAQRLAISTHTARRHTEKVLRRAGVASRAQVALRLLRPPVGGSS